MNKFAETQKRLAKKYRRSGDVAQARAILERLRESGVRPKRYELTSPYGHKSKVAKDSPFKFK